MTLEEITIFQEVGVPTGALILIYVFSKWTMERAFRQVQDANRRGEEAQQRYVVFIENAYKENTKAMTKLVESFKDHIKTKERALDMLEDRQKKLEENYERLRKYHET